ncbi:g9843 [Coccomyxa viridis]|uniref:G9843 protein n=1 Tax=Coccomyxa viridis TaxID=1274662 RepID=A0ABP1GA41_9CHLO
MAEGLYSAASVAWDKENMNATPAKRDSAGQGPDSVSKRGRTVLAAIMPPSREKATKRRKSMKPGNRRVSFAPDDQLTMLHHYTKDDDRHATPNKGLNEDPSPRRIYMDNSPADPPAGDNIGLFLEPLQGWGTGRLSHSPAIMASPTAVSMELTGGSQDDPYGRAEDMTGLSMLSGDMLPGSTGGITAGVPGLADILEQDWSEDSMGRPAHSEPTPPSVTPRSMPALRPARSAPPLMTPLTEETEGDLRSTSHAQGQSGTFGLLGTGHLSTARQDDFEELPGLFGTSDVTDNMSLNSNTGHSPRDADAQTTGHTGHLSLGYTNILEGGHHPAWGEAADVTKAVSMGQLTDELQEEGPKDGMGQVSKWGFVPGDDNTTDLDLERNGLAVMGDVTYRHVFQDMTTESRRASMMLPAPADITEESPFSKEAPVQPPVQDTPGQESEAGSPRPAVVESALPAVTAGHLIPTVQLLSASPKPQSRPAQKRRRSSMADLTGRLLMDDSEEGLAMLAPPGSAGGLAPPSSPQDSPAGRGGPAGRDMTTGLLLEDTSAPAGADEDSGQLGQLRKRLTLLQGSQKPRESEGLGRQDSSGHLTLNLLPSSTTQLLAATQTAMPGRPAADTSGLLAEMTMASAAGEPAAEVEAIDMDDAAEDLLTPPAQQQAALTPLSQVQMAPLQDGRPHSPDLLEDESLKDIGVPPELPPGWAPAPLGTEGTPLRALIPGGPLLARTPPPSIHRVRAHVTPMQALTAGSPLSPTPLATSQVSYPMPNEDTQGMEDIPGGPKLPRTPQGPQSVGARSGARTPAPSPQEAAAESPGISFAPGSQASRQVSSMARHTPHNLIPSGRMLARTPTSQLRAAPAPMTFQDFLKEVDLQFLDHMRRGTSINFADLASDPPPATMQERYSLLYLTAPAVEEMEESIRKLREVIAAHKETMAEKEAEIGCNNPSIFRTLQGCSPQEADTVKEAVATLKRLCRQRTMLSWKEWREAVEKDRRQPTLQRTKAELEGEVSALTASLEALRSTSSGICQLAGEAAKAAELEAAAHQEEAARRERLVRMRASLAEEQRSNAERARRQDAARQRLLSLQTQHADLGSERERLQAALAQRQSASVAAAAAPEPDASVDALLGAVDVMELQSGLLGWQVEKLTKCTNPAAHSVTVRMGFFFRLTLEVQEGGAVSGALELTQPGEAPAWQERHRALAVGLAAAFLGKGGQPLGTLLQVSAEQASAAELKPVLLEMKTQVSRIADIIVDADSLYMRFPRLASMKTESGSLHLTFLNLAAELKFSVAIPLGSLLLQGDLDCSAKVHFPGRAGLQAAAVEAAVKGAPPGYSRLLAVCERLAELAEADVGNAAPSASGTTSGACTAEAADETAPLNVFSNPLYTYATPKNIRV